MSFFFLLSLYCSRYIPISFFWNTYSIFGNRVRKISLLNNFIVLTVLIIAYSLALIVSLIPVIFLLNLAFQDNHRDFIVPFLLGTNIELKYFFIKNRSNKLYQFLVLPPFTSKIFISLGKIILRIIEVFSLILIGIGGAEVYNDFNSHLNPDIFDILFPQSGGTFFFGGISLLIFNSFFLYLIFSQQNFFEWKKRIIKAQNIYPPFKNYIISSSLLHPYFFLSFKEKKLLTGESNNHSVFTLLKKACRENSKISN